MIPHTVMVLKDREAMYPRQGYPWPGKPGYPVDMGKRAYS